MAVLHVVGALGLTTAFGVLTIAISAWEQERVRKRRLQDAAIALGVPVAAIENEPSLLPSVMQYASRRSSDELLRNRISDMCGLIRTGWGWLGGLLQVGVMAGVGWYMYTYGAESAASMWAVLFVAVFFWLASVVFSLACVLLTGRYPGEAKLARKAIAASIEQGAGAFFTPKEG
ncbi:hypothetical protein [Acidovorax radicis]|uniref:hypothetical protein n=1 Tax=Acidovorax radicis TaxID=758826 RepID=UPI001CFB1E3E|nr:hypothetical protein [Acidovorax radicis]UCV01062.1 hypothetical protein KI609_10225 [Acidovorax radicis]